MNEKLDQQFFDVNFDLHDNKYEPIKTIGRFSQIGQVSATIDSLCSRKWRVWCCLLGPSSQNGDECRHQENRQCLRTFSDRHANVS